MYVYYYTEVVDLIETKFLFRYTISGKMTLPVAVTWNFSLRSLKLYSF